MRAIALAAVVVAVVPRRPSMVACGRIQRSRAPRLIVQGRIVDCSRSG